MDGSPPFLLVFLVWAPTMFAEVWESVKDSVGGQGWVWEGLGTQAGLEGFEGLGSAI